MEGDEQRRRQHYEQPNYLRGYVPEHGAPGTNVSNLQHLRGPHIAENPDQFRHGQLLTARTPTSMPMAAGVGPSQDFGAFAYSQGQQYQASQMPPPSFPYQPEFLHDPQRQRFPQHSPQMYNVPQQPQSQSPYSIPQTQPSYDPATPYQSRQASATEVLSSQFGVPQQYYSSGDVPNTNASSILPQGYSAAPYQQGLQYNPPSALGRSTLASPYPTMPSDFSQASGAETPEQSTDTTADHNNRIYRAIGLTNHRTSRGMLTLAGASLMEITDWLLSNAARLGLTKDDYAMHAQRLALWDNFNNCWLALLQRQLDDTQVALRTGRPPVEPQTLLPQETLETMGDKIVAHCNVLARVGLVDYQMGVSEEEIIEMLNRCLDLLRTSDDDEGQPEEDPPPSQAPQRRGNR